MAKASWNEVEPTYAPGDATAQSGGTVHTGRLSRPSTLTFRLVYKPSVKVTVEQTQSSPGNIHTRLGEGTVVFDEEGGSFIIKGYSNASRLTLSLSGSGYDFITDGSAVEPETTTAPPVEGSDIPEIMEDPTNPPTESPTEIPTDPPANGPKSKLEISTNGGETWGSATSGASISGDPGAGAQYLWRTAVGIGINYSGSTRSGTLSVTPAEGTALTVSFQQGASTTDGSLEVSPTSLTIPADGTPQTITVTASEPWEVI